MEDPPEVQGAPASCILLDPQGRPLHRGALLFISVQVLFGLVLSRAPEPPRSYYQGGSYVVCFSFPLVRFLALQYKPPP